MSDYPSGPYWEQASNGKWYQPGVLSRAGWWRASDNRWYRPEQAPAARSRPDLETWEVGQHYDHSTTGAIVRYIGRASMPELRGEEVGIFEYFKIDGHLIATMAGFQRGETFTLPGLRSSALIVLAAAIDETIDTMFDEDDD